MFQRYLQNRAVARLTGRHGQLTKGGSVKRFALILAATGVMGAALATSASANPPDAARWLRGSRDDPSRDDRVGSGSHQQGGDLRPSLQSRRLTNQGG